MSDQEYPVSVAVRRPDGSVEQVRVGSAIKSGDGFVLRLGELVMAGAPVARPSAPPPGPGGAPTTLPNYGRSKGAPIAGASMQDLEYYANGCRRTLDDPGKARWHDKERALLAAIEAEIARQKGGDGGQEPPPHDDSDIPF